MTQAISEALSASPLSAPRRPERGGLMTQAISEALSASPISATRRPERTD